MTNKFDKVKKELEQAYEKIKNIKKGINFFGSARLPETSKYYKMAEQSAYRLAKKGFTIITGAGPSCVDGDTEHFNGYEWKPIKNYQTGDKVAQYTKDGYLELVKPNKFIKSPKEYLTRFKTKYGIDQCLSDNHRVVYVNEDNKIDLKVKPFNEIKKRHSKSKEGYRIRFLTTFKRNINTQLPYSDIMLRLFIAIQADGTFHKNSKTNRVQFAIKKERKKKRLESLLKQAKIDFYKGKMGINTSYYFNVPIRTKIFDKKFYKASYPQLQIIAEEVFHWDGSKGRKNRIGRYFTTVKQNADFIQYVFTVLGYRASIKKEIKKQKNHKPVYTVHPTKRITVGLRNRNKIKMKPYKTKDGFMYCFNVPSGMLVLRRSNNIFITGNCMKAANKGADRAGKRTVGLNIELPFEQEANKYVSDLIEFKYFYTRKVIFTISSLATVIFPGGFGTMDEMFEQLTLIQNSKIKPRSFVLVGTDYHKPLIKFIKSLAKKGAISKRDLDIITYADDVDTIVDTTIKKYETQRKQRYI